MAGFLDSVGAVLGTSNRDQINAAKDSLADVLSRAETTSASNKQLLNQYLQTMQDTYGVGSANYSEAVQNVADAIANYGDFNYDKSVESFLDPAREQRTQRAMDAITSASSAGGNRFSSNYLDKLAAKQQALASEEWEKAFDKYQQDRASARADWQTGQQKIDNLGTLAGLYGTDRTALADALGDYYSNIVGQNNADLQTYSNVASNAANLEAQKNNGVWDAVGGIGKIIGAFF